MGLRATAIKEYKVEYGETAGFNDCVDIVADIIRAYCSCYYLGYDGFPDESAIWEVDKAEFKAMLDNIKNMTDDEFKSKIYDKRCDLTRNETVRVFEGFLEETPDNEEWVRFGWI